MHRFCAIFNTLVGILGVLFCIGFSMLAIGLGGSGSITMSGVLELARLVGPIGNAGLLYCWSGVALWRSFPSVQKSTLVLVGCAWALSVAHCIQFLVILNGRIGPGGRPGGAGGRLDEEAVMFVFIPMAVVLLITIEFVYLRRKSKQHAAEVKAAGATPAR